jgi:probable rRNA maturation factor
MAQKIITLNRHSPSWSRIKGLEARLEKAAKITQRHLPKQFRFPATVNLLLTTNAELRRLNRDFRGIDKPTNVLSFPQHESVFLGQFRTKKSPVELGDIAIAYQYIVGEAKKAHKILINHVTHLFIHGFLHLFGYDHIMELEAGRMERLETKIMAALDLPDPYATAPEMETKRRRKAAKKRRSAPRPRP